MAKRESKKKQATEAEISPDNYWETKQRLEKVGRKLFVQKIFVDWCKACGICVAFCPAAVFEKDENNMPVIRDPDACTGCRFCEFHCPDFALSIHERYPDRRKKKNGS